MPFTNKDKHRIQELAKEVMEIAALPIQAEKRELWRRLNRLEPVRPLVWINEIPWDELKGEELDPAAEDRFVRNMESHLRITLYLWRHMQTDMVVDGFFESPFVYEDSGHGLDWINTHEGAGEAGIGSAEYQPKMETEEDLLHISMPVITPDWQATEENYQKCCELLDGVMPVLKMGVKHMWCAPWDLLIQYWGIERLYMDMVDRPDFVHRGIGRMMDALLIRLDQLETLGLLSVGNGNHRVGSGGLGITDLLPQADYDGSHARTIDQWGTSTGQIFSEVSPAMHDEFSLQHELRWLDRFGLNCYGCCEPLHNKMSILKQIPRLRRISMSRWIKIEKAVEVVGRDYVFSYKPNPGIVAWDVWNPEEARRDFQNVLEKTRGCVVELILKDITTCRKDPKRLWEWCEIAMQEVEKYD